MSPTATTVGGYLRDLPADRRVAMARVCSMIRRSARGVRESMRYGLAFYELQGPLFALESTEKRMILFIAEPSVLENYKSLLTGVLEDRSAIEFIDLNRIPLDSLEKIVRDSVAARRERLKTGKAPTQKELLVLWKINEEAKAPPPVVRIPMKEEVTEETVVEAVPEEPKEPVEILRAPTFKDPAMTASSRPRVKKAATEEKPVKRTRAKAAKDDSAAPKKATAAKKTTTKKSSAKEEPASAGDESKKAAAPKKAAAAKKTAVKKASARKTAAKKTTEKAEA